MRQKANEANVKWGQDEVATTRRLEDWVGFSFLVSKSTDKTARLAFRGISSTLGLARVI